MSRDPHDHGEASDAIDYALDELRDFTSDFLRAWREGDLGEWPEFHHWLDKRRAREKAESAAMRKAAKAFRLFPADYGPADGPTRGQGNPATDASILKTNPPEGA